MRAFYISTVALGVLLSVASTLWPHTAVPSPLIWRAAATWEGLLLATWGAAAWAFYAACNARLLGLSPGLHYTLVPALLTFTVEFLILALYWHVLAFARLLVNIDAHWQRACELQGMIDRWYAAPIVISFVLVGLRQRRLRRSSGQ